MLGRAVTLVATALALLLLASCPRPRTSGAPKVTGTCQGACEYYQACRRSDDSDVYQACVSECTDFFNGAQALSELERLDCEELVAFIEGPSGRAPGQP